MDADAAALTRRSTRAEPARIRYSHGTMTSSSVSISTFGSTRARIGGELVNLGSRGQRAVLARLVAAGPRIVSTDELIEDLWAGAPPPSALGALQVNISNLRKALEPGRKPRTPATVLVSSPPGYALDLTSDAVDIWKFEKLIADGTRSADVVERSRLLSEALDMWQEWPFAEVLDTSWATVASDRLLEQRRSAYEERARVLLDLGEPAQVIVDMEKLVRHVPHREEGVRLLALALYRSGRQSEALEALRACREHLSTEMGIDPGPALREVEADILAHRVGQERSLRSDPKEQERSLRDSLGAPALSTEPTGPTVVSDAPFTNGRPEDLLTLRAAADRAAQSGLTVVWVGGEAGEGKSTLAQLLSRNLTENHWTVGWGQCPEVDGAPPGWVWTEILTSLAAVFPMDDTTRERLAPLLDSDGGAHSPAVGPFWLGRWLGDYVKQIADGRPVLLVVDDVHRADALTTGILRQLSNEVAAHHVLLVGTYRPSEVGDDLATAWSTMTDTYSVWHALRGIERDRILELAEQFGLHTRSPALADMLVERTGGNPLFVRELARLVVSEGADAARDAVPLGISDVLRRRLSRLPERTLSTLRWASVLGRDVDIEVLAAIAGIEEDNLLDDLEPAVLAGLLSEPGGDRLRFTHALVRDTLYFDLPRIRRTRAHARALSVLEKSAPEDHAALAYHAAHGATASTARSAVVHIVAAARRAEAVSSHTEALALWNSALSTLDLSSAASDIERLALIVPLVGSHARAGNTVDARRRRQQAIDLATSLGDRRALIDAVTAWRAPVIWHIRDLDADEGILGPITSLLQHDSLDSADRIRILVARFFELEGLDDDISIATVREALELAEELGDARALCAALNAFGYLAYGPDFTSERVSRAQQLLDVAEAEGFVEYQALAHYQLFLAANASCDLIAARSHVHSAVSLASGSALNQLLGVLTIYGALIDVIAGRYDSALAKYAATSASMNEQSEWHGDESGAMGRLSIAVATGNFSEVSPVLAELDAHIPVSMRNALVLALAESGNIDAARDLWPRTPPHARDYLWRGMTALRARAAALLNDKVVAAECYRELLPFAGTLAGVDSGSMYAGIVDDTLAVVAAALGDHDAASRHRADAVKVTGQVAVQLSAPGWVDAP